jgi:hypothetical protein
VVIRKEWSKTMNEQDSNRHNDERFEEEFELTAQEKKALKELKRDRVPSDLLEERVISALHGRGFLTQPRRRVIESTAWRYMAAAAACLALIVAGFILGRWTGSRQSLDIDNGIQVSDGFSVAASVQQTGTAYFQALQQLAHVPSDADNDQEKQGREVALTTLCTAADQVARLVPKDVLSGQLLASLDNYTYSREGGISSDVTINRNQIIEF